MFQNIILLRPKLVIGFAAETNDIQKNAEKKTNRKKL